MQRAPGHRGINMSDFESFMKLENKDAVIASLQAISGEVQAQVVEKMKEGGSQVKKSLRASLPPGSGEPSSPGGVPYSQTGELASKIQATVMPLMLNEPITLKVHVTQKGFHGRMLEFGTSKMPARPWFFSGIAQMFPFLKDQVVAARDAVIARSNARKK